MRILVVSDSDARQQALVEHLHELGYPKVDAVESVDGARVTHQQENPAIVIIDFMMPGTSATELLRTLGHPPERTIIISHTKIDSFSKKLSKLKLPKSGHDVRTPVYTSHPITFTKLKRAMKDVTASAR